MGCAKSSLSALGAVEELVVGELSPKGLSGASRLGKAAKSRQPAPPASPRPLLELLRDGSATPGDIWVRASFALQLEQLVQEHPYLDVNSSTEPHPLQNWVSRCRESADAGKYRRAQQHLRRIRGGLEAEKRPIAEAFRRFDLDSSGHLDAAEFRQMCAYLGWGEEEASLMDLDRDGRVTLQDMQAFVGHMGGVRRFFEKRRLRITTSRQDVCNYAGISVGARVWAHFYIRGQKSKTWKEAQVVAVGVERKNVDGSGPGWLGVLLEFEFGIGKRKHKWRARQVVPTSWVLGGIEDASVAAALTEVGIMDEQQSYWSLLLPDSEMHAMRQLTGKQRAALKLVRGRSTAVHDEALAQVRQRFQGLGFGEWELQAVLGWIQDLAPVVIHLDIDWMGHFLETDEFYRSQFETKIGKGDGEDYATNNVRTQWEHDLFGGCYDDAKPFERCKYGALNIMNDYRGVVSAMRYGDSYLVLKDVRLRSTFTAADSAGLSTSALAVLDKYAHVLQDYPDQEICALVRVATAAIAPEEAGGRPSVDRARLELLRGLSEDPASEWVTMGFPGLKQQSGRYYFEVQLQDGCCAPQVGLLSSKFERKPFAASAQGVGDDEHGWAVDGQNSARWHAGVCRAWKTSWPCKKAGEERVLSQEVVIGVLVDFGRREFWFSSDGQWEEAPTFGPNDIPVGLALYPALSLRGRATFNFGPRLKYPLPESRGGPASAAQWPSTPGCCVRVDCPDLGNSEVVSVYKEVQIHGEVSLKRNVQRLVANSKYREASKTRRSYKLYVPDYGPCGGTYRRVGARAGMPLYKSDLGAVLYWDAPAKLWRMAEADDPSRIFSSAPPAEGRQSEPPRSGWRLPDHVWGALDTGIFRAVLEHFGLPREEIERLVQVLTPKDKKTPGSGGKVFRKNGEVCFAEEWKGLAAPPTTADDVWFTGIEETQQRLLDEAGLGGAHVVETSHPYAAERDFWRHEVTIPDTMGLSVYFASKTCTLDEESHFRIIAGGLQRKAAGVGARVEVLASSGHKLWGTVAERSCGGQLWRVRLDRRKAQPEEAQSSSSDESGAWPSVGDVVEARYRRGAWYEATVAEVRTAVDWYGAVRKVTAYVVNWADGNTQDREKLPHELRRRRPANANGHDLEDLPRFAAVASEEDCFALCAEAPKVAAVAYGGPESASSDGSSERGLAVSDEIASFGLDRACPLSPIHVQRFAGPGPAQQQGVQEGWYLDLAASVLGPSREPLARALEGLGDVGLESTTDGALGRLLDAAFGDPEALIARLNGALRDLSNVTLFFTNSSTLQQVTLRPEALATYSRSQRVSSEVQQFKSKAQTLKGCPLCSRTLEWSDYAGGGYMAGWMCNNMEACGNDASRVGPWRWLCIECRNDFCQDCYDGLDVAAARCSVGHLMRPDPRTYHTCNMCCTVGTTHRCSQGCDYDLCGACHASVSPSKGVCQVQPDGFLKRGPAQDAGVRTDWVLDITRTQEENPALAELLQEEVLLENPNVLLALADVTLVFRQPHPQKSQKFRASGPADSEIWRCEDLPGDTADFEFWTDGDGVDDPERRWGVWALVLPQGAPRPSTQRVDALADRWVDVTSKALGRGFELQVEREEWDEARLRALCQRHGWDFEWMTEDGERRRRVHERAGFYRTSGRLSGARAAAEAAKAAVLARQEAAAEDTDGPRRPEGKGDPPGVGSPERGEATDSPAVMEI